MVRVEQTNRVHMMGQAGQQVIFCSPVRVPGIRLSLIGYPAHLTAVRVVIATLHPAAVVRVQATGSNVCVQGGTCCSMRRFLYAHVSIASSVQKRNSGLRRSGRAETLLLPLDRGSTDRHVEP